MKPKPLHKILVANRGEIAQRIIRAIQGEGKTAVAIYSKADEFLPFVESADETWPIGHGTLAETYLNQEKIIRIAKQSGADAIHPGYGFLAENEAFASLCRKNGIIFIGPEPDVIRQMGNKSNARDTARQFGVPVMEGSSGSAAELLEKAGSYSYPLLVKPAAGGGGKGMRIVDDPKGLAVEIEDAAREALNYFGSDELYVERYIEKARHIEVQVLADNHGNAVHLYERECTLQRRYQKIIEEAPSPSLSDKTRDELAGSALDLIKGIGYTSSGTVEYLMDENERFFFIEMNTRIQVEHPVTEMITGIDIVREQIRIAEGRPLSFTQEDVRIKGHSVEARVYAEDPENDFLPVAGPIHRYDAPANSCRIDSGYSTGNRITPYYDPLISKVVSIGQSRDEAVSELISGLRNLHISGVKTNREFLLSLLSSADFAENRIFTKYLDGRLEHILHTIRSGRKSIGQHILLSAAATISLLHTYSSLREPSVWEEAGHWRPLPAVQMTLDGETRKIPYSKLVHGRKYSFEIAGETIPVKVLEKAGNIYKLLVNGEPVTCWADIDRSEIILDISEFSYLVRRSDIPDYRYLGISSGAKNSHRPGTITAPLNGKIVKINIRENDRVKEGDTLLVIESMKMENRIDAPGEGIINKINVQDGELVEMNSVLITFK